MEITSGIVYYLTENFWFISEGITTIEGEKVSFAFNADQFQHEDVEAILSNPEYFEFDPENYHAGIFVKPDYQGKIHLNKLVEIVNRSSIGMELFDLNHKTLLAPESAVRKNEWPHSRVEEKNGVLPSEYKVNFYTINTSANNIRNSHI